MTKKHKNTKFLLKVGHEKHINWRDKRFVAEIQQLRNREKILIEAQLKSVIYVSERTFLFFRRIKRSYLRVKSSENRDKNKK